MERNEATGSKDAHLPDLTLATLARHMGRMVAERIFRAATISCCGKNPAESEVDDDQTSFIARPQGHHPEAPG
ncbi:MAG: hypothetical protein KJ831_09810 [Candidatus Eisenbacteria bacterium]|nr:hypothetical protein [Candidatus Eisenbacteria bacterium]